MPIVLTPIAGPPAGPVTCSSMSIIHPDTPTNVNGCPIVTKTPTVTMTVGVNGTIEWVVRDSAGNPVDLTTCLGYVTIRFQEIMGCCTTVYEVTAPDVDLSDAAAGIIRFQVPPEVLANPCIWMMEIAVYTDEDVLVFTNKGFLSIERGLFNLGNEHSCGPITIGEIRIQLRDTMLENDLHDNVEFDDTEIIHSIIQPIRYWNEVPPPVAFFTTCDFPWHHHWLKATCANLLRISATWYLRNKLQVTHGGAQDDSRDRDREYMVLGQLYQKEWEEFVIAKKVEINLRRCWGSIS